jgi:rhamnogalacturonyl hydrolase YesR
MEELTWMIGKPMKFLARLYAATGEKKYLECARTAFDFFLKLDQRAWNNPASCKIMWASAELYRITGEERYWAAAVRILNHICESQLPGGGWVHSLWYKTESDQPFPAAVDIVSEFGSEISDVLYDISSR